MILFALIQKMILLGLTGRTDVTCFNPAVYYCANTNLKLSRSCLISDDATVIPRDLLSVPRLLVINLPIFLFFYLSLSPSHLAGVSSLTYLSRTTCSRLE